MAVKTEVAGKSSCELLSRQLPHSLVGTQWQPLIKVSGWSTASADPDKGQGQFWVGMDAKAHKYESHLPEFRASP